MVVIMVLQICTMSERYFMLKVHFIPNNVSVDADPGADLLETARRAGITIAAPCGGKGTCGKCRVHVIEGEVERGSDPISDQGSDPLVCACRTRVAGTPLVIEIPESSRIDETEAVTSPLDETFAEIAPEGSLAESITLQVGAPMPEDGLSDIDRLKNAVTAATGVQHVAYPLSVMQCAADRLRRENGSVTVTLHADEPAGIVRIQSGRVMTGHYGVAVDLGTTTIAVALVDLKTGAVRSGKSTYNGQIPFGLDVISRINYAARHNGLSDLRKSVLETINNLLRAVADEHGVESADITAAIISGNTVMIHLLLGLNPEYIRLHPYTPTLLDVPVFSAQEIGLAVCPDAVIYISPCVGSYVGGDITAGILCCGLAADADALRLFIDVGTNGEIVIGNRDFLMTCACSAGPAFEGGGIDCGMRASPGAISSVAVDAKTGVPAIGVIGNVKPRGICGSGMIELIAALFTHGWLDQSGKLNRDMPSPNVRIDGRRARYLLAGANESATGRELWISETDIENILRAKAAVYSACALMLSHIGAGFNDIERVYVGGGFGKSLNIMNAITIGLLPDLPPQRFTYIGNSSLYGSYLLLLSAEKRRLQKELARKMTYIDLSSDPTYMDQYIAALFLPHTDMRLFPSVESGRRKT